MSKWKIAKYVILTVLLVGGIFVSIIGYQIYNHVSWYLLEDNINFYFGPVVNSLERYVKENQRIPESLDIVPDKEMSGVKQLKEVVSTTYTAIPDRQAWRLDVIVKARGIERQFIHVSDGKLTEDEKARYYVWCHDWDVLTVPKK